MLDAPLVSVLLPAHQAAPTLPACLASLARQTEPRWECILVDDGSTDDTRAGARRAAAADPRLVVVETPHRGLVAALQTGLARCRAPVIARMDADDVMHRDRLAAQLGTLAANPALSAVGTHVRLFPRATLSDGLRAYERWLNSVDSPARLRAEAFVECPIVHPTLAIRTAVLREHGYRDRGWPEDYDLVLRLLDAGHAIGMVTRRLLAWRDHPGRLTRTADAYRLERFTALKAAFLVDGPLAATERYLLWGFGHTGRALRAALAAHGRHPTHVIEMHPGRLGQKYHGADVVPPDALPHLPRHPLIVSVAGETPRSEIRQFLGTIGFTELRDYVCAA